MKHSFLLAAAALATSFAASAATNTFNLPASMNGAMARLYNFDTEQITDSVVVADGKAVFRSDFIKPYAATLVVGDQEVVPIYIFDNNGVTIDVKEPSQPGAPYSVEAKGGLNDTYSQVMGELTQTAETYNSGQANNMNDDFTVVVHDAILASTKRNIDNPVGYLMVVMFGQQWLQEDIPGLIRDFPFLEKYNKVEKMLTQMRGLKKTQPGNLYTNFEVSYDGTTHYLSDVVGKGDYVLVDFWASWCVPCRKEMRHILKAQKVYGDKGLKVLGIAVWDNPANSLKAATDWGLPWPVWINGTEKVTDLYGITGIPCIILFGPDGTILARDLHGDDISATIARYLK